MIRKVLLATINYSHPQRGMQHAFEGIFGASNVETFDYLQQQRNGFSKEVVSGAFRGAVKDFQPDWVFLQLQETDVLDPEVLAEVTRSGKCVVSHWTGDARAEVSPYFAKVCGSTHLTLASSYGHLEAYRKAGAPEARYMQIGVDWAEDVLGEYDAWMPLFDVPDVVFCGGFYGNVFPGTQERLAAIAALRDAKIDVGVVGPGWPASVPVVGQCHVKQQHHVWSRAKVCLNINHFNDLDRYYSDRQLIAMASGTPLVCSYIPGLEAEFTNGEHLYWFRDTKELVERVQELLSNEERRVRIGAAGRAEVIRNHTWFSRILDVLPEIERIWTDL